MVSNTRIRSSICFFLPGSCPLEHTVSPTFMTFSFLTRRCSVTVYFLQAVFISTSMIPISIRVTTRKTVEKNDDRTLSQLYFKTPLPLFYLSFSLLRGDSNSFTNRYILLSGSAMLLNDGYSSNKSKFDAISRAILGCTVRVHP